MGMIPLNEGLREVVSNYIDLGTSSYIWQIIIAIGLGGLATIGFYWKRILSWCKGLFNGDKDKNS